MRDLWQSGSFWLILILGILIALSGIAPLSKTVRDGFEGAQRAQEVAHSEMVASNLAAVADEQPWRLGLWEAAGNSALEAGAYENAAIYYSRAAEKGELSQDGYLAWGDADWGSGSPKTALQIGDIAKGLGVSPEELLARQSDVFRAVGDDLALIESLRGMLTRPSSVMGQQQNISDLNRELGLLLAAYDPASAPAYLSQAIESDPAIEPQIRRLNFDILRALSQDDPVYLLMISGRGLAKLGKWDLAEKAFENAVKSDPEYAEAWAYLGEARQHTGSGADPLADLQTALELDSSSIASNTFLALYWQRQNEYEIALEYLLAAEKLEPDNPANLVEIGNLVALLGDLDAGRAYYLQAIRLSSNDPKIVREFLEFNLNFNLDLREVALPFARQLVIDNPTDPASQDVMGVLLMRLGDLLNAERFFLQALALDPEFDQAHLHLGDLYRSQEKHRLARFHYGRVLEVSMNARTVARAQEALEPTLSP